MLLQLAALSSTIKQPALGSASRVVDAKSHDNIDEESLERDVTRLVRVNIYGIRS